MALAEIEFSITDPDNASGLVTIDWGDGQSEQINPAGFGSGLIVAQHNYAFSGNMTATVTAFDGVNYHSDTAFLKVIIDNPSGGNLTRQTTGIVAQSNQVIENLCFDDFGPSDPLPIHVPPGANNVTIRNCAFTRCVCPIKIESGSSNVTVNGNYFRDNGTHIQVRGCTNPEVSYNLMGLFGVYDIATSMHSLGWSGNAIQFNGSASNNNNINCQYNVIDTTHTHMDENTIWNAPHGGQEDAISIFNVRGIVSGPFQVSHNYIRGRRGRGSPTGGGVTGGDSGGGSVRILSNRIVDYGGFGLGVAGGTGFEVGWNLAYAGMEHTPNGIRWHPHNGDQNGGASWNGNAGWGSSITAYSAAFGCSDNYIHDNDTLYYNNIYGWKGSGDDQQAGGCASISGVHNIPSGCTGINYVNNEFGNCFPHSNSNDGLVAPGGTMFERHGSTIDYFDLTQTCGGSAL